MDSNPESILDDHRKMLTLSKSLSDFQINNLQKWPLVAFNNVKDSSVQYNFLDQEDVFYAGEVFYKITVDSEVIDDEVKKRALALINWTKALFWNDTNVEVDINGERINGSV